MTHEEIKNSFEACGQYVTGRDYALIKTIEKLIQPKRERNFCERCGKRLFDGIHTCTPPAEQPKREWVGLTLDESSACYEKSGGNLSRFAKAIEAKLKEKNT